MSDDRGTGCTKHHRVLARLIPPKAPFLFGTTVACSRHRRTRSERPRVDVKPAVTVHVVSSSSTDRQPKNTSKLEVKFTGHF